MPVVTKLVDIGQVFTGSGSTWYRPQRSVWNGDPIYIDQYSASATYNSTGPNAVNLVLQGEDRFGDVSAYAVQIASYTTGMSVNNVEIADKGVALLSSPIQGLANGGAFWVTPTAGSPGSFDIKFRTFSFQPSAIARDTGFADTYNLGTEVTLKSGIANYNSLDFDWITPASGPILILGYTTRAANASTQDVYYQAFNGQGQALGPSTLVASGLRVGGAFGLTDNGTDFFFAKEVVSGGVTSIEVRSFTPATGALGAATTITTNFASLFSMAVQPQADGTFDIVVDGLTAGNQHFLAVYQANASFVVSAAPTSIALASASGIRTNVQRMANDSMVVAYADAGQVHLAVFDAAGTLLDNTVVPGITNFDRIRSLGQNQFELVWRETVSGNENAVKGAIYDVNTSGRVVDQSGSATSVWQLGSYFDDTLKGGSAGDIFKGYGGNDTIIGNSGQDMAKYTGNKADYTLVRNGDGSWTATDTRGGSPDGTDTLQSIEIADFADGQKQLISAQATELAKLGAVFLDSTNAPITGAVWARSHRAAWNGDVVYIDNYASKNGYVSGGPNPQTLVVGGQDRFGDLDKAVVLANYTSGKTVNNAEMLDKGVILYKQAASSSSVDGKAFWVTPTAGAPAGTFDVKLQAMSFAAGKLAYDTGSPSVTLVGSPTTLFSGVANYQSTDWNSASDGTVVIGYTTRAVGASVQDFWYATVNTTTGTAAFAPKKIATLPASGVGAMSVSGNQFTFISEDNSGAAAKLIFQNFDTATGGLVAAGVADPGNLADIFNFSDIVQSDGSRLFVMEGTQLGTGAHVLQTFTVNSLNIPIGTPTTTMLTAGQSLARIQHQLLGNGLNIVGYTDNSQVHLSLFDQFGNLVSDTIVPGITNFDRLRGIGQNQFELIWRETVSGVENVVKAAIFDGNDGGRFINLSGSSTAQWLLGSHSDDVLTAGSANDIIKGYGGNDSIDGGGGINEAKYTGNMSDYGIVHNVDGSWTVTDTRGGASDGVDTLRNIQVLDFADRAVTLGLAANTDTGATVAGAASGNVLTNDARPVGDALVVRSVNGSTAKVGTAVAGTYGTLTLNADGGYTYTASGASGPVGSHLHDVFSYVMADATVAVVFGSAAASAPAATLDITLNRTAVVSASTFTPPHRSATMAASTLFSVADADADTITKYQFWDDTAASTSGHWTLSGVAQGTGQGIEVTAANLANMQWTVGSTADTIFIRAFDGIEWGAWKSATINPSPESAPVVVANATVTPAHGATSLLASSLFSATDADGDTITKYRLWDGTSGSSSGHWTVSGVEKAANTTSEITAADLANTVWTAGAVSDAVSVQAFDGVSWSAWKNFTIAAPPNAAPVVAAPNFTPAHGVVSTQASALFSATDADGDTITKYRLWDGTSGSSSGHWTVSGVEKAANTTFEITAADLANTVWTAGAVSDAVSVQAFDGVSWSAWKNFTIAAPPNAAPVVAAPNFTPAHGVVSTQASALFSATDADGDTITKYRLWDGTSGSSSGHWTVSGVEKAANTTFEITAADLANTVWTAGAVSDAVSVQAFDGVSWSAWKNFTIAAPPNAAPVVAAPNFTPAHGVVSTQASALFSATDADGDTITKYRLWDGTSGSSSGHWTVSGVEKAANTTFEITAADLANTVWTAGAVSDAVSVQAFDGVSWSAWKNFTIAAPPNAAPVVAAPNFTPAHGVVSTQASALFSATDADGDTITKYRLWDGTSGSSSGHWTVSGVEKAANTTFEITAADLANTVWTAGAVSDAVSVQAFDGVSWSAWKNFTIAAPPNAAPVVAAPNFTPAHGVVSTQASALFSATDADGDTITKYRLWDGTSGSSSGHWTVSGVEKAANTTFEITAADLANTVWTAGAVSDAVSVQAFDGVSWSAWKNFTIAAPPNAAPVVSAPDKTATHGQAFAASALFSATDTDGDTITKYQLWDGNTAESSGHWTVNGTVKAAGQAIDVTAADLANTTFQSGSGSDLLYARAFDGLVWGDWKAFTVSAPVDSAPVVSATAPTVSLTFNQSVAASSLFSVTDAENDAITKYQFWDGTPDTSSGHWSVNGAPRQAQQTVEVLAADLASASFTAGSAAATDQLFVRAFDGYLWSDWKAFSATSHA